MGLARAGFGQDLAAVRLDAPAMQLEARDLRRRQFRKHLLPALRQQPTRRAQGNSITISSR